MKAKPKSAAPTTSVQDWLLRVLCGAGVAWLVAYVDSSLMTNYATSVFWETWFSPGSPLATWVPLITFASLIGVLAGLIIGWVFPVHVAIKVAAIAALLQLVAAVLSGGIAIGIVLAVGLLLGALPSRTR